jgi:hypothetical protein
MEEISQLPITNLIRWGGLACIIHDDLRKSSKALLRNESGDLPKKQTVFWSAVAVRVSQVGE